MSRYEKISQTFTSDELLVMDEALRVFLRNVGAGRGDAMELLDLVDGGYWAWRFAQSNSSSGSRRKS